MPQILNDIFLAINNREKAIILWLIILVVLASLKTSIRNSIKHLINAFFQKKLVQIYLAMILYVVGVTILLKKFEFWDVKNLPTTLKWFFIVAFVMLFNFEKANNPDYFKNSLRDNLKVLVIVEFIVNLYVFNILVEFLVFPIILMLSIILALSETDSKYESVNKFLNGTFAIIGIFLLFYAVNQIISDFSGFITYKNLNDFYQPILYSLAFIPFVYLVALYSNYETFFVRLSFFVEDKSVLRYAKFKSIYAIKFNIQDLSRWSNYINSNWRFKDKQEVDDAILVFTKSLKEKKNIT